MNAPSYYMRAAKILVAIVGLLTFGSESFCGHVRGIARLQEAFDNALPKLMDRRRVPGLAVGIVMEGQVAWVKGYGYSDKKRRIPVTEHTLFQVASISKPVTAWAVMKLVEEGKLQLDVPVSKYLTRWKLPRSRFDSDKVTLRRILSHTAGLSIQGYLGFMPEARLQTLEESLTAAVDADNQPLTILFQPGRGWYYSGGGFTLMQLVIEEATKQPFAEFAQSAVLRPLRMTNSEWKVTEAVRSQMAVAYNRASVPLPDYRFTAEAAAGLRATATDLARFVAALMPAPSKTPPGRGVLKPQTINEMLTPQPNSSNDLLFHRSYWGLGYGLKLLNAKGDLLVFHPGDNTPGWHGLVAALPGQKSGFVALTNGEEGRKLRMDAFCLWLELQGLLDKLSECNECGKQSWR